MEKKEFNWENIMLNIEYNKDGLHMTALVNNEAERKAIVKAMTYTIRDINEITNKTDKAEAKKLETKPLATIKQKALMDRWGIKYDDKTTIEEAIKFIDDYKKSHNMKQRAGYSIYNGPTAPVQTVQYDDAEEINNIFDEGE